MKMRTIMLFFIIVMTISTISNASECKFIIEHVQFGDSLNRVKEKKIGWNYGGLITNKDGDLVATFSKSISDISMGDKWCICIWQKVMGVHFDKEEKVNGVTLIIANTISQKKVVKLCNKTDVNKCIDSGTPIFGDYLAILITRYGPPVEEKGKHYTKFSWEDNGFTLVMLWSPIKTTIFLKKSK